MSSTGYVSENDQLKGLLVCFGYGETLGLQLSCLFYIEKAWLLAWSFN